MPPIIIVYGNADKSEKGFPRPEDLQEWIARGIFRNEKGRYRYTQQKTADIIVVAREGFAFGHFEVGGMEKPTEEDRFEYPPVRQVYLVSKSFLYSQMVNLSKMGISRYQFGKSLTEQQFAEIQKEAGKVEVFCP